MPQSLKQKATNNAYCLLRQRPRSEQEIRKRLRLKGYEDDIVNEVVLDLKKSGELDDAKFAKLWVDARISFNPMGEIVLRRELKAKGVSDTIINATLAECLKTYDEYDAALKMAREQFDRFAKLDKRKAMKRMYDFLARRGFKFDVIERVIEKTIEDQ
jgi:regulatory protein